MQSWLLSALATAALAVAACAGTAAPPVVDGAASARARIVGSVIRANGSARD